MGRRCSTPSGLRFVVFLTQGGAPRLRRGAYPGLRCMTPLGSGHRTPGPFTGAFLKPPAQLVVADILVDGRLKGEKLIPI